MNMLRHDYIATDDKQIPLAHRLKGSLKEVACRNRAEIRKSVITAESDEMKAAALLITNQTLWHGRSVLPLLKSEKWGTQNLLGRADIGHAPKA
jgi:hypothetical protein